MSHILFILDFVLFRYVGAARLVTSPVNLSTCYWAQRAFCIFIRSFLPFVSLGIFLAK